jgi:glycine/D-amino acid oxidase-like deaminating enzyme
MSCRAPDALLTSDFRAAPYWWDAVPRPALPEVALPARADAVVIGSGYTGLSAALQLARGGRHTVVLDASDAGWGCSTRNGGQVSTGLKPGFADLAPLHGAERAFAMVKEGHHALAFTEDFIRSEKIECRWERVGRFIGAHNAKSYDKLARRVANQAKGLEVEAHILPRAEQRSEIGTDAYFGGAVYPAHAALDPALYHQGMLSRVQAAGASVIAPCAAQSIERDGQGFKVRTARGTIAARDLLVATNGYTDRISPDLRRRVIPIGSYIIATEPLDPALASRLIPKARVVSDTRRVIFYYRLSPDRRRMLFGGRVATRESDPVLTAPMLHAEMAALFPDLAQTRLSHSWAGFVAYTFDTMPHLGQRGGIWYAMGYCGAGVALAGYFGMRVGQQMLGRKEGRTALDGVAFPTRPLYSGEPWFLGPALVWKRLLDRLPV